MAVVANDVANFQVTKVFSKRFVRKSEGKSLKFGKLVFLF